MAQKYTKYVTFSYDDGVRQDIRLTEMFRKYGLKATFNLNSGSLGAVGRLVHRGFDVCFDKIKPDEVKDVYAGFEVASHGVKHLNFPTLSDAELDEEVCGDVAELEKLTGKKVTGAAYPCGVYDEKIPRRLRERGIVYCRTINDTHGFSVPEDFCLWHPTCHDNDEQAHSLASRFVNENSEKPRVLYIWGHSFEFDKNDKDRWYNMEKLCELVTGKDDICYATNREIYDALCGANA